MASRVVSLIPSARASGTPERMISPRRPTPAVSRTVSAMPEVGGEAAKEGALARSATPDTMTARAIAPLGREHTQNEIAQPMLRSPQPEKASGSPYGSADRSAADLA